jgi:hypothetical protein
MRMMMMMMRMMMRMMMMMVPINDDWKNMIMLNIMMFAMITIMRVLRMYSDDLHLIISNFPTALSILRVLCMCRFLYIYI